MPSGNHFVTIHLAYKKIADGKASTAALLSVLEYLAESSLARWPDWNPGDPLPDVIEIAGTCTNGLLMSLLDGLIKESSLKAKLKMLVKMGYIKTKIFAGRNRHIWYCRSEIAAALAEPGLLDKGSKSDGSISDGSISDGKGSKIAGSRGQKVTARGQKLPTTIPITNTLTNLSLEDPPIVPPQTGGFSGSAVDLSSREVEVGQDDLDAGHKSVKAWIEKQQISSEASNPEKGETSRESQSKTFNSQVKKPWRKRGVAAEAVNAMLAEHDPDVFEGWWAWYRDLCDEINSLPGCRIEAAKAWLDGHAAETPLDLDKFRQGCQLFAAKVRKAKYGAPNGYIFLKGKVGHPTPYWLSELESVGVAGGTFIDNAATLSSEDIPAALGRALKATRYQNTYEASGACPDCPRVATTGDLKPADALILVRWLEQQAEVAV